MIFFKTIFALIAFSLLGNIVEPAFPAPPTPNAPIVANFEGIAYSDTNTIPPDTHGAIGRTQYVQIVNGRVAVYSKTETPQLLSSLPLANFFGYVTQPLFDPRVIYDSSDDRWVITAEAWPESGTVQYQFIAVSTTSDATGSYYTYKINVSPDGKFWDFPQLGVSRNAILITANIYNAPPPYGVFRYSSLLSINKRNLYKGKLLFKRFDNLIDGSLAPPIVMDRNATAYIVSAPLSGNVIKLYKLAFAGTKDNLSGPVDIPITYYSVPPPAPQPETTVLLDTSDARFSNASTQVGDYLWQVHTIAGGRDSARAINRYYKINTNTFTVSQVGEFSRSESSFDFNVSITANENNMAFVTWTATDVDTQAQIRASFKYDHEASFGPGRAVFTSSTFYNPSGYTSAIERWGDYSATVIDPTYSEQAWGTSQKINDPLTWGSRIFNLNDISRIYVVDQGNYRTQIFNRDGEYLSEYVAYGNLSLIADHLHIYEASPDGVGIRDRQGNPISGFYSNFFSQIHAMSLDSSQLYFAGEKYSRGSIPNYVEILTKDVNHISAFTGAFRYPDPSFIGTVIDMSANSNYIHLLTYEYWDYYILISTFTKNGLFISQTAPYGRDKVPSHLGGDRIAADEQKMYVVHRYAHTVGILDKNGNLISEFGGYGIDPGKFIEPSGIAISNSRIFVVDRGNNRVQVFTKDGIYVSQFGSFGSGRGEFDRPLLITVDSVQ